VFSYSVNEQGSSNDGLGSFLHYKISLVQNPYQTRRNGEQWRKLFYMQRNHPHPGRLANIVSYNKIYLPLFKFFMSLHRCTRVYSKVAGLSR